MDDLYQLCECGMRLSGREVQPRQAWNPDLILEILITRSCRAYQAMRRSSVYDVCI